jgi:hypothetical protein
MNDPQSMTIRFTSGVCVDGVDYGPRHRDEPLLLPTNIARWYLERGVARQEAPLTELAPDPSEPEIDAEAGPAEVETVTTPEVEAETAPPAPKRKATRKKATRKKKG